MGWIGDGAYDHGSSVANVLADGKRAGRSPPAIDVKRSTNCRRHDWISGSPKELVRRAASQRYQRDASRSAPPRTPSSSRTTKPAATPSRSPTMVCRRIRRPAIRSRQRYVTFRSMRALGRRGGQGCGELSPPPGPAIASASGAGGSGGADDGESKAALDEIRPRVHDRPVGAVEVHLVEQHEKPMRP